MVTEVTLRPATEADVEAITEIQAAAYWSNFNVLEPASHDHPGYYDKVMAGAKADAIADWSNTIIAEFSNQPIAVCILEFDPALLSGLWVKPEMQGKGIGGLLIADAFERF